MVCIIYFIAHSVWTGHVSSVHSHMWAAPTILDSIVLYSTFISFFVEPLQ